MHLLAASPTRELPARCCVTRSFDAAAVKHRFCNSFRGLSPLNLFEFGGVAFVLPVLE